MYRIDNDSAVATLPVAPPPGIAGFFTGGNPSVGLLATKLDAWWANMVQEEILAVVTAAGLTPQKTDNRQLLEALGALYLGHGSLAGYLPLAGGTMTGYPLLLARDPVLNMEAATRQFVLAQVGGTTPTGFLPLTGGTLYNPTHSGPLTLHADQGSNAGVTYIVANTRQWFAGILPSGVFEVADQTSGRVWNFNLDASTSLPGNLQIGGAGVQYYGLSTAPHVVGFTWTGTQINAYVDGILQGPVAAGNFLPITGGTLTGSLTISGSNNLSVGGTGYFATNLSTAGNLNVTGDYSGHSITVSGGITVNAGGLNVAAGGLLVNGNINAGDIAGHTLSASGGILVNAGGLDVIAGGLNVSSGPVTISADASIGGKATVADFQSNLNCYVPSGWIRAGGTLYADNNIVIPWNTGIGDASNHQLVGFDPSGGAELGFDCPNVYTNAYLRAQGGLNVSGGDINCSGVSYAVNHVNTSDRRLKENLADYHRGLDAVRQLRPQTWQWIEGVPFAGQSDCGLVADDVATVAPEMVRETTVTPEIVRETTAKDDKTIRGVILMPLICALINATQELAAKVEALEAR